MLEGALLTEELAVGYSLGLSLGNLERFTDGLSEGETLFEGPSEGSLLGEELTVSSSLGDSLGSLLGD